MIGTVSRFHRTVFQELAPLLGRLLQRFRVNRASRQPIPIAKFTRLIRRNGLAIGKNDFYMLMVVITMYVRITGRTMVDDMM